MFVKSAKIGDIFVNHAKRSLVKNVAKHTIRHVLVVDIQINFACNRK
jgi:hypothetical protein